MSQVLYPPSPSQGPAYVLRQCCPSETFRGSRDQQIQGRGGGFCLCLPACEHDNLVIGIEEMGQRALDSSSMCYAAAASNCSVSTSPAKDQRTFCGRKTITPPCADQRQQRSNKFMGRMGGIGESSCWLMEAAIWSLAIQQQARASQAASSINKLDERDIALSQTLLPRTRGCLWDNRQSKSFLRSRRVV